MTLESFRQEVLDNIGDYLPSDWRDAIIMPRDYLKANTQVCGIIFEKAGQDDKGIAPTLDMQGWYEEYLDGYTMDEILPEIADAVTIAYIHSPDKELVYELESKKDQIVYEFIHTEQNREYLKGLPHREFHDLSIIYSWYFDIPDGKGSIKLTNALAEEIGLSEEQLFELAQENTKRLFPSQIRNLSSVLLETVKDGPGELVEDLKKYSDTCPFYMISNEKASFGAIAILDTEIQERMSEIIGEDFYLIPSSRHEMLALGKSIIEWERVGKMVSEVNAEHVELHERLSNNVYQYDCEKKEITVAYESPNKRLDDYGTSPERERVPSEPSR